MGIIVNSAHHQSVVAETTIDGLYWNEELAFAVTHTTTITSTAWNLAAPVGGTADLVESTTDLTTATLRPEKGGAWVVSCLVNAGTANQALYPVTLNVLEVDPSTPVYGKRMVTMDPSVVLQPSSGMTEFHSSTTSMPSWKDSAGTIHTAATSATLATGLSTKLSLDGTTVPTANIPFGGFQPTGVGDPTTSTSAVPRNWILSAASRLFGSLALLAASTTAAAGHVANELTGYVRYACKETAETPIPGVLVASAVTGLQWHQGEPGHVYFWPAGGGADDQANLNALIAREYGASGLKRTIVCKKGDYRAHVPGPGTPCSDLRLRYMSGSTLTCNMPGHDGEPTHVPFLFLATYPTLDTTTLTTAIAVGDTHAHMASITAPVIAAGSMVRISANTQGQCFTVVGDPVLVEGEPDTWILTLDRRTSVPVPISGSKVAVITARPTNIQIHGNGLIISGPAGRYIGIENGLDVHIHDVYMMPGDNHPVCASFDTFGRRCGRHNCKAISNYGGATIGFLTESNEDVIDTDCYAEGCGLGFWTGDGIRTGWINCVGERNGINFCIGSQDITTNGGTDCFMYGGSARESKAEGQGGVVIKSGALRTQIIGVRSAFNTYANFLLSHDYGAPINTLIANCTSEGLISTPPSAGVMIGDVHGTELRNHHSLNEQYPVSCSGDLKIRTMEATGFAFLNLATKSGYVVDAEDVTLDNTTYPTGNDIGAIYWTGAGRGKFSRLKVTSAAASSMAAITNAVAVLEFDNVTTVGMGSGFGISATSGNVASTVRLGANCNFASCGTAVDPDIHCSRGEVQLTGNTPVDVVFADIRTEDFINLEPKTYAGTPGKKPTWAIVEGTKFTVVGDALDTSTYYYEVA